MKSRKSRAFAALPLAIGLVNEVVHSNVTAPSPPSARTGGASKEFSVPFGNLRTWAKNVVVSMDNIKVEGSSGVHKLEEDCEIHFGAHTPAFQGDPDGLVLEPMNACNKDLDPPEGSTSWSAFARGLKDKVITASGVPRIWPEHLNGGTPSNPDHGVELHPLTAMVTDMGTFDFAANIFAGEYSGKPNNQRIAGLVSAEVTVSGQTVNISCRCGPPGNFTTLDLLIERASIADDGAGSFRMNGEASIDDSTTVPVRIVTAKGSPINDSIKKIKKRTGTESMPGALILYSLSPEALLYAANKSQGDPVAVDRPIQLILYGTPDSQ
jgi:hypothetical protein